MRDMMNYHRLRIFRSCVRIGKHAGGGGGGGAGGSGFENEG